MALFKRYCVLSQQLATDGSQDFDEAAKTATDYHEIITEDCASKSKDANKENQVNLPAKSDLLSKDKANVIEPVYPQIPTKVP